MRGVCDGESLFRHFDLTENGRHFLPDDKISQFPAIFSTKKGPVGPILVGAVRNLSWKLHFWPFFLVLRQKRGLGGC